MKSSTLLDCIAFQLTPTRTRCDLVITGNGKTEKIASGLLDPFVVHLKAAKDQIGKGGYSISLKPPLGIDTTWFTKGTVERFVRFVSTPEILERVCTIESEILQIEKAISFQSSNDSVLDNDIDRPVKSEKTLEGSKHALGSNEDKAIVLYQPVNNQADDHSTLLEKNSKVQLVQVLETRKSVLLKEQGMAFARAVAASFDINNITALLAFAECFGASRMMDACKKFVYLWKAKHESGQWVEVEATEAMSCPVDVSSPSSSGIVFHESIESSPGEVASEKNGKSDHHHHSQHNPLFSPRHMNTQANGMPVFQPYPMQGMPYYQTTPGNMFFQSPYPPLNDPRLYPGQRTSQRRHSVDSEDTGGELETQETGTFRRRKGGRSSRKQAGKVVIRNINYIASTKQGSGDSDSQSCSDSGSNDDGRHMGNETRKLQKKGVPHMSDNPLKSFSGDDGHWQAFQNFLLIDADDSSNSVNTLFEMEGKIQGMNRQNTTGDAFSALGRHNMGERKDVGFSDRLDIFGEETCMPKRVDDIDYMFNRQENVSDLAYSSVGPAILNGYRGPGNNNKRGSAHGMGDESFVVLNRAGSLDQVDGDGRAVMHMDYQLPPLLQKADNLTVDTSQSNYEANDLNLMPDRPTEGGINGYDPAMDYEMEAQVKETAEQSVNSKRATLGAKQGSKKTVKDQKLKGERTPASTRREKPSKSGPLEDARARAEKLRAYKADLQKLKKEKEEEQLKRLEALKIERQKRIAARNSGTVTQLPSPSQQSRKQLPKFSPTSQKGSKFSDTEPGSSSPLQRSTIKLVRKVSSDSSKISNPRRSIIGNQSTGNRLTRSASSLSIRNEENNGPTLESKATISRIRRLSEPKNTVHHISLGNAESSEAVSRRKVAESSIQKKSAKKEQFQKPSEKMISTAPITSNSSRGASHPTRDGDDSTIVEKTVVMLEFKKPVIPVFHQPKVDTRLHNTQLNIDKDVGVISEEDTSIPPPASPIVVKEVDIEPSIQEVKGHSYTCVNELHEALPNLPIVGATEEPYQAPYSRFSSTEDPCMAESDYGKALPTSVLMTVAGVPSNTVVVSDGQRQDSIKTSQGASVKYQGKVSPKGFKRLLMFGRRGSSASETNIELDKTSGSNSGDNALNGSSSEVLTLKNLLNQEESSSIVTPPKKSSRSFSLLSPFKCKSVEKKHTT